MQRLTRDILSDIAGDVRVESAPAGPERILQFGEGNFLRAFVDWMVHRANVAGVFDGRVVVVQPLARGMTESLDRQDGLYTALIRGRDAGSVVDAAEVVASVSRTIDPYQRWDAFLASAGQGELRVLVSNTTEAGIAYAPTPRPTDACPASFPAKVTAWLHERWRRFDGDAAAGMLVLPCELIERNAENLKALVLRHAREWTLEAGFLDWVETCNRFCNTLVDRIVPGYPADEAEALAERFGYDDRLIVATEPYHIWAIEGPAELAAELPLAAAGCNVVFTDDLRSYRYRKVRILNGSHMAMVPPGFLAGRNTVGECVDDPVVGRFLRATLREEILPSLAMPAAEAEAYAATTLERFANPFMRHELLAISLNSVAKFPVRLLPTMLDYVAARGVVPTRMALSLAAMFAFYRGTEIVDGVLQGSRDGRPYPIRDGAETLEFFAGLWRTYETDGDADALCRIALGASSFWGRDLNGIDGLGEVVSEHLRAILDGRIVERLERLGVDG